MYKHYKPFQIKSYFSFNYITYSVTKKLDMAIQFEYDPSPTLFEENNLI